MKNGETIIGGACVYRDHRGKRQWLVVKHNPDSNWEIPKVTARRGESSVRASLRLMGEQGGMTVRVLEEAGRATGSMSLGNKSIHQKFFYYVMVLKAGVEVMGFADFEWCELPKAARKITLKREKQIIKDAKNVLKVWEKKYKVKKSRS